MFWQTPQKPAIWYALLGQFVFHIAGRNGRFRFYEPKAKGDTKDNIENIAKQ